MVRIAITGSFSTGKTTLAKQVAKAKKIKVLPEVARMMFEKGFKLDREITVEVERLMGQFQKELELETESWIADRCFIDLLAYVLTIFPEEEELHNEINDLLNKAKYDIVIYTPIEFPIEDDGVRSTDPEFQKTIDKKIRQLLKTIPHIIIKGSKKERLKEALKYL